MHDHSGARQVVENEIEVDFSASFVSSSCTITTRDDIFDELKDIDGYAKYSRS